MSLERLRNSARTSRRVTDGEHAKMIVTESRSYNEIVETNKRAFLFRDVA